jgi:transcriptional regulator with XRE-family HTH domain
MNNPDAILKKIGSKLTQLRIKNGHGSYETFATEHNLSRMQYWRMEKGKTNLTMKSLLRILKIHNISIEEFFRKDKS